MRSQFRRSLLRRGFSLLEMFAVIGVVAILSTLGWVGWQAWLSNTQDGVAAEILKAVVTDAREHVGTDSRDAFDIDDLFEAVAALPEDTAAAPGLTASQRVVFDASPRPSLEYGHVSAGVFADGSHAVTAMVSKSGRCIRVEGGLAGEMEVENLGVVGDACQARSSIPSAAEDPGPPPPPVLCGGAVECPSDDQHVALSWDDSPVNDLDSYELYRAPGACAAGNEGVLLSEKAPGETTHDDHDVTNDETYCYWVIAIDRAQNRSTDSNRAEGNPADTTPPTQPVCAVTGVPYAMEITTTESQDPPHYGPVTYRFERVDVMGADADDTAGETRTVLHTATDHSAPFLDIEGNGGITPGNTYTYRVVAVDPSGNEAFSTQCAAEAILPDPLDAPLVQAAGGIKRMIVSWNDMSDNEWAESYEVFKDGSSVPVATIDVGDTPQWVDCGTGTLPASCDLEDGSQHSYTVVVRDRFDTTSDPGAATGSVISAPTSLTAKATPTNNTEHRIDLSWSAGLGGTEFEVSGTGISPTTLNPTTGHAMTMAISGRPSNAAHSYTVRACEEYDTQKQCTDPSVPADVHTLPAVTHLTASNGTANKVDLSWEVPPGGVTSWQMYRAPGGTTNWQLLTSGLKPPESGQTVHFANTESAGGHQNMQVADGGKYNYMLVAHGPGGARNPGSNVAAGSTMARPAAPTLSRPQLWQHLGAPFQSPLVCPAGVRNSMWSLPTHHCWVRISGGSGATEFHVQLSHQPTGWATAWRKLGGTGTQEVNLGGHTPAATGGRFWLGPHRNVNGADRLQVHVIARNEAGDTATFAYSHAAPRPDTPTIYFDATAFFHHNIRLSAHRARTFETLFHTSDGARPGGIACNGCTGYAGSTSTFSARINRNLRPTHFTFHVLPPASTCQAVTCQASLTMPMGNLVRTSGANQRLDMPAVVIPDSLGALHSHASDGWCVPTLDRPAHGTGEPWRGHTAQGYSNCTDVQRQG